jgi:hypothetical protein
MYSALRRSSSWTLLCAVLIWTARGLPQSRIQSPIVVDLRTYGWEAPIQHAYDRPSIAVDSHGRVVVAFTVRARQGLVTRSQPSLDFHIIRFLPDGKLDLSLSLPTHVKTVNNVYLSDTDQIIARANGSLELLRADNGGWEVLCPAPCSASQALSRHTLVLHTGDADSPMMIVRLSPQPLLQRCGKPAQSLESPEDRIQNYTNIITDKFVYFHGSEPESGSFTYRWPLCDYEHRVEIPLQIGGPWEALNDDSFVTYSLSKRSNNWELEVISSDGRLKFRPTLQEHESAGTIWTPVRSNKLGTIIAVDLLTIRGGNRALDMSGHVTARRIAVYDIEARIQRTSIQVSPKHNYGFQFDLSPDGRYLAILEDNILKLINLEEIPKPRTE